jgi:hypothetical protein
MDNYSAVIVICGGNLEIGNHGFGDALNIKY